MRTYPLLAGTLAGILTGATYLSTPSTAKEPPARPSPAPSASALEDIAKLQEKMRDVVLNGRKYVHLVGSYFLVPSSEKPRESHRLDYSLREFLEYLEDTIYSKGFPRVLPIVLVLSNKEVLTLNRKGDPVSYQAASCLRKGSLAKAIVHSYEGAVRRCQRAVTDLETDVTVVREDIILTNSKTRIELTNHITSLARCAEDVILFGKLREHPEDHMLGGHRVLFEDGGIVLNVLGLDDQLLILYNDLKESDQ